MHLPAEITVEASKNMNYNSTSTNYAILPEWVKVQLEKKIISIFKNMQIVGFEQRSAEFTENFVP